MTVPTKSRAEIKALAKDLRAGSRAVLARAITLIESRRGDHQAAARDLVQTLLPQTGKDVKPSPRKQASQEADVNGKISEACDTSESPPSQPAAPE